MSKCEVCGNHYESDLRIVKDGREHVFDCFECAIHALAPPCQACGCRIIGHGVQHGADIYCSAHCARRVGVTGLRDHD